MESGFPSPDRCQVCREHRTGSPLWRSGTSGAPCLNRVQSALRRLCRADFDNSERPAGVGLCVYCDVGFEFGFSPHISGAVVPRVRCGNLDLNNSYLIFARTLLAVERFPGHQGWSSLSAWSSACRSTYD